MAFGAWVCEYFKIVPAIKGLVTKEVDLVEVSFFDEIEAIGFVPTLRKHIERDLSTNTKLELEMSKCLLHSLDHVLPNVISQIKLLVVISLLSGTIATDRADI